MTIETMKHEPAMSAPSIGRQFYRDVVHLLMRSGDFFTSLPVTKSRRDTLFFLGLSAAIYSLLATFFVTGNRAMFFSLHVMNALLMPVVTAIVLHLLFRIVYPGRYSYALLFAVTAYANVMLLFAWIPGIAPLAEVFKYVLIGQGLVKTGGISGLKAFFAIATTMTVLVMMVYFFRYVMQF